MIAEANARGPHGPAGNRLALAGICLALGLADLVLLNVVVLSRVTAPARGVAAVPVAPPVRPEPAPAPPLTVATAVPLPEPAPTRAATPASPVFATAVYFNTGDAVLDLRARAALAAVAGRLAENPAWTLSIEGHADARGDADGNERLSQQRAAVVGRQLQVKGLAASRLALRAFGSTRPAVQGDDPAALRRNRRVEILIERGSP